MYVVFNCEIWNYKIDFSYLDMPHLEYLQVVSPGIYKKR